jgi:dolichyl-phosphate-mannose--protein O-mannosyl transferase
MKLFIVVTGIAFGLLFLAHVARVLLEGWHVAMSVVFIVTSLGSLAICVWAFWLYRQLRGGKESDETSA